MTTDEHNEESHPYRRKTDPLDPAEVAIRLTAALEENTTLLRKVQRRQRWTALVVGLLTWVAIAGGVLYWEVRQTQIENCARDNTMRVGLLNVANFLDDSVDRAEEAGTPTDTIERNREFIADMRRDFAIHEC